MTLAEFPSYCSKDMSAMQLPSLLDSFKSSFDIGEVSEDDVELLQVRAFVSLRLGSNDCSEAFGPVVSW